MRNLTINFDITLDSKAEVKGCKAIVDMTGATDEDIALLMENSSSLKVRIQNGNVRKLTASAVRAMFVEKTARYSWRGPFTVPDPEKQTRAVEAALDGMSEAQLLAILAKRGLTVHLGKDETTETLG